MDVLIPLFHLVLRSLVVLFPLTVGCLAFRRLALSKSDNAWIYAATCLFAAISSAGVLPWALGMTSINWIMNLLALCCPGIWIGVLLICDVSRSHRYSQDPIVWTARFFFAKPEQELVAETGEAHTAPAVPPPVFQHKPKTFPKVSTKSYEASNSASTIVALAREIRGNRTSDRRRPKLLPAPKSRELPFLRRPTDV